MSQWVYIRSEPSLWTVGFYCPDGSWEPESDHGSDHGSDNDAAKRVRWLNGGRDDEDSADSAEAALAAAAPIILAAELRRLADWHFPSEPNSREGEAVCAVLNALRGRADELERGTR